jgi:hypothetical protein
MLTGYSVLQEQNIFDVVNSFYGGFDNMYSFVQANPQIENINFDFNSNPNTIVYYDNSILPNTPSEIPIIATSEASNLVALKAIDQQNIFDVCAMSYGSFDLMYKLLQDNNILKNINDSILGVNFTYDKTLVHDDIVYGYLNNNKITIGTGGITVEPIIPYYFDLKSLFTDGHSWRFRVDDTGQLSFPGEDIGITNANTSLIIGQWLVTVNDNGEFNEQDLGVISGDLFMLIRSSQIQGHVWQFTPNINEVFPQPGTDLGL